MTAVDAVEKRLEHYVASWRARDCLQGTVALLLPNGRTFAASGGMADPAHGIANDEFTRYRIGSLTKSFTAAAVLQLVGAGRIQLDTPVSTFFPRLRHASQMTVLQLLTHRAGVANHTAQPDYWPLRMRLSHTPQTLIEWIHELPPIASPGEAVAYSNSGYVLLAHIVELTSEMELRQYQERRLFAPADLSSLTADDGRHPIPRAARGLHHAGQWTYAEPMDMSVAWGAYDLVATAPDICRWLNALQTGRVVPRQLLGLMFDTVTGAHSCGFSMGTWRLAGTEHRLAQHFGDVNGFFAFMSVLPGGGAVAVLSNAFGMPVERLAHDIARGAAGDELPPLSPALAPSQEEPEPPPYLGRYRADDGAELVIGWQGGQVMLESRRRYGVPMRYPAWRQSGHSNRLLTRVLPESVDITVCDGYRAAWVDAEGLTRRLERIVD